MQHLPRRLANNESEHPFVTLEQSRCVAGLHPTIYALRSRAERLGFSGPADELHVSGRRRVRFAERARGACRMYGSEEVACVLELVREGHSFSEISRRTGVSRSAIRDWSRNGLSRTDISLEAK